MVGYALDTNGEIINTTFIPMNKRDFGRIKKMLNYNVLYFKERKNDFQYFNEKQRDYLKRICYFQWRT